MKSVRHSVSCSSVSFHQVCSFSLQQSPRHPRWNCSILVPECSFRSSGRTLPVSWCSTAGSAGSLLPNRPETLPLSLSFSLSHRNPERASCLYTCPTPTHGQPRRETCSFFLPTFFSLPGVVPRFLAGL